MDHQPICKDCKFYKEKYPYPICKHPYSKIEEVNEITGNKLELYESCIEMRYDACSEGRLFEKNEEVKK